MERDARGAGGEFAPALLAGDLPEAQGVAIECAHHVHLRGEEDDAGEFHGAFLIRCSSAMRRVSGPGLPSPIAAPSMATTGTAAPEADEMKAPRALFASCGVKARSTTGSCASAAASRITRRVTPGRIAFDSARVMTRPSASTIQAVVEAPSVTKPSRPTSQAS